MKVHLYKENCYDSSKFKMQCGFKVYGGLADIYETIDHNAVTCKNCRKTQAFKDLVQTNNETKKAIEEMNKIKEEQIEKFKDSDPIFDGKIKKEKSVGYDDSKLNKTYKQDETISLTVPVGYVFDRSSVIGKHTDGKGVDIEVFFKKKVKTGAELIGCLCGVSAISVKEAENNANQLFNVAVVKTYGERSGMYGCGARGFETYAYPVPAEKLDELKAKLMS